MLTRSLLTPSLELSPGMRACSVVSDSATPRTVALQASLSMGFPRQEYWSGLPFPPPGDLPYPGMETDAPALQVDFFFTGKFWMAGPKWDRLWHYCSPLRGHWSSTQSSSTRTHVPASTL